MSITGRLKRSATMYTITNLSPATYQVRVRAVRDGVPGLWSIPLSAVVTSGTVLVATVRADDASIQQGETADFTITLVPCATECNGRKCNGVGYG